MRTHTHARARTRASLASHNFGNVGSREFVGVDGDRVSAGIVVAVVGVVVVVGVVDIGGNVGAVQRRAAVIRRLLQSKKHVEL